ncbi:hypothetical protein EJM73_08720 [Clostridium botulinum]|uniref:hypothetical protein n=1 Tax=Clostridium botulinum TaxID=1491 RepID=UPI0013764228|nr:hypothetical protein [Clostridium botulinum]NCI19706.1 hypothetical protein [Clostridium botulinum]NCI35744.1 hypothetical protein [Clostridium botulinum]NCI71601.1 hypothetical protein [Clostridium botulinum]NDI38793.1 hypothetical protein [Clostridium botulinum]
MGKLFDKLNNVQVAKNQIEKYLKERGFYIDTMSPIFLNGYDYDKLTLNKSCLRHDSIINQGDTLSIFINEIDIYFEVQSSYSSYITSDRYNSQDYLTVSDIDTLLDEIMEEVII